MSRCHYEQTLFIAGFSVLMFIATIWILVANRKSEDINRPMVVIACLLFVFSTTVRLKFVRGGWLIGTMFNILPATLNVSTLA
jgi:hypothetical protein